MCSTFKYVGIALKVFFPKSFIVVFYIKVIPDKTTPIVVKMSARVDFRAPKKHKGMIRDIAHNRGVKEADIYRQALEDYLSTFSQIPTLKALWNQVERHEKRLNDIEKASLKKGVLE